MRENLVSCIVPVYNGERYISEALDSIVAQTYRPIEIIVADDGSTDGTAAVVAEYGREIRFVSQSTAGPAATRNLGLGAVNSDFVAFLDADDLWHLEKLDRQMKRFTELPELEISITHVQLFWVNELSGEKEYYKNHLRTEPVPGYTSGTLLARRRVFEKVGKFNTDLWFGDATDWFMRAREKSAFIEVLPDVLTYHRMHPKNLTRRRSEESRDEFLRIVKDSLERRKRNT
jgi:glycosyltransferase involved in cell wall biosynthesis